MYFNAQSLGANLRQLKGIIPKANFSLIFISEARITEDIHDNEIHLKNYNTYRMNSNTKRTGGVVIYVRNDLIVKKVERLCVEMNYWLLALTVKINNWNGIVACVYRSPSCKGDQEKLFVDAFIKWCDEHIDITDNLLICGDFNINWLTNSTSKKKLYECLNDLNLIQIVDKPTRITENTATLIDLCITNDKTFSIEIRSDLNISDHETLLIKSEKISSKPNSFKTVNKIENYDSALFQNYLLYGCNWSMCPYVDLTERAQILIQNLKKCINKFVVKKTINITEKCMWYNDQINSLKIDKINSYERAKLTDDHIDWEFYKTMRNQYLNELRNAENNYYSKKVIENRDDLKKMWTVLKEILGKKIQKPIKSVQIDNNIYSDKQKIANELNAYFVKSIE